MSAGLIISFGPLAACADGEAAEHISNDLDVVDAAATSGTADGEVLDQTKALICDTDRKTLETALEAFYAMEGRQPTDESELVGTFLRSLSSSYDISPTGAVIPAPGSICT